MMKQVKRKKSVKGMTLIEIIVAIAVLGVAGLVLVRIGSVSNNLMKATNHLNNKVDIEAPYAASRADDPTAVEGTVSIKINGNDLSEISYDATKYTTKSKAAAIGEDGDNQQPMNADLYYYTLN